MIIDQLTAIQSPNSTDELPIERGQLTYKITYDDLVGSGLTSVENDIDTLQTDVGDVSNLTTIASNCVGAINEVNANLKKAIVMPSAAFAIPASGSSVTKSMTGITSDHYLVKWNFSTSAENKPPVDLTWTTGNGTFTITNNSGTTSESIQPIFALPDSVTAT